VVVISLKLDLLGESRWAKEASTRHFCSVLVDRLMGRGGEVDEKDGVEVWARPSWFG